MPLMTGNRDDIVRTKAGHSISFKAGEDTFVPDINEVVKDCIERGHSLKQEKTPVASKPAPTPVVDADPAVAQTSEKKAAPK